MAYKIKFTEAEDFKDTIHFVGTINDYTLCGLTLDMDAKTCGDYESTKEKVNCEDCITIVKLCKTVNSKEFISKLTK